MKKLFKFKYPKLTILILMIILAYYLFRNENIQIFVKGLGGLSYLGSFIAGVFFAFGFLAPFAVGFFIVLKITGIQIIINAIIGGFGAMIADLFIFKIIKLSFMDEFRKLKRTDFFLEINKIFSQKPISRVRLYLLYTFAGIIIASPLSDEIGITMLAGLTKIKTNVLAVISFILNTIGILILILL